MIDRDDLSRMDEALALASRGWGQVSPNPLVGAVIYRDGEKISEGFHARFGEAHAEAAALASAGGRARGATLYVTLEPCAHHGKTPPCTDSIIASGIRRVVAAVSDPNPVAAGGFEKLRAAGISVDVGAREAEARELNAGFFHASGSDRPWVTLKLALSLDGAITGAGRESGWLSGEESRARVQRMRAGSDAVAVGVQTAIADDPQLTARTDPAPRVPPLRVIFDRNARLSAQGFLARTAREIPALIVTAPSTRMPADLASLGVEQLTAEDLDDALRQLKSRGVMTLMVEGGAGLAASFLAADAVDRLVIFRAPIILGSGALGAFSAIASQEVSRAPRFTLLATAALGDDVMSTYAVRAP
ncbi:MAG TPA: bifunctional diaminohydroxyphosphoribosylaminopyrimidine deaminase/5-amino-6-(5-phosphoribosylamino)uracil reductase RibD [Gemmatimonadaceae bacterium]